MTENNVSALIMENLDLSGRWLFFEMSGGEGKKLLLTDSFESAGALDRKGPLNVVTQPFLIRIFILGE